MAISSIISFGFGNGTFSPGVAKLPTLGYSIASGDVIGVGPFCFQSVQAFQPGPQATQCHAAGFVQSQVFQASSESTQMGCS